MSPWNSSLLPPNTSLGWLDPGTPNASLCELSLHLHYTHLLLWLLQTPDPKEGCSMASLASQHPIHGQLHLFKRHVTDSSGSGHLRVCCLSQGPRGFPQRGTCCLFWSVLCACSSEAAPPHAPTGATGELADLQ